MDIDEILKAYREEILKIAAKYRAYNVRVFGSVARGEARPDSVSKLEAEFLDVTLYDDYYPAIVT